MSHGAHKLEVYFIATLEEDLVESNHLYYDLICYELGNTTPIIASTYAESAEQEQYVAFTIKYRAYTYNHVTTKIEQYIDGERIGGILDVGTSWQA